MLNIYGHFLSMPTNKVRLCVSYLGLPHDYHHIDLQKGEQQSPEYLKINPAGRVPAIDDDGFLLSQSDAICKYMCALSGPSSFYPDDIQKQAKINQWIDFTSQHILSAIGRVFFNRVVAKLLGQEPDESSLKTGLAMLDRDLPTFEAQLAAHEFVAGDKITLADIALAAAIEPAEMCGVDLTPYKSIVKWRAAIMEREFYKRVHARFAAEMGS